MNRPIRVRAKKFDSPEWFYGGGVEVFDKVGLMISKDKEGRPIMHEVDPKTVGEFTGLLDKNGQEIWEWDVLKPFRSNRDVEPFVVRWDASQARFHCSNDSQVYIDVANWEQREVIGNVYENPELLTASTGLSG